MVLRVDVVDAALTAAYGEGQRPRIVPLSPTGPVRTSWSEAPAALTRIEPEAFALRETA